MHRSVLANDRYRVPLTDQWSYVAPDPFDFNLSGHYETHQSPNDYSDIRRRGNLVYPTSSNHTCTLSDKYGTYPVNYGNSNSLPSPHHFLQTEQFVTRTIASLPKRKHWVWIPEDNNSSNKEETKKKSTQDLDETWIWNGRTIHSVRDVSLSSSLKAPTHQIGEETRSLCEQADSLQNASNDHVASLLQRLETKLEENKKEGELEATSKKQPGKIRQGTTQREEVTSSLSSDLLPEAPAPPFSESSITMLPPRSPTIPRR